MQYKQLINRLMKEIKERDLAQFAADTVVLILFLVALICLLGFACVLYFFIWLIGLV